MVKNIQMFCCGQIAHFGQNLFVDNNNTLVFFAIKTNDDFFRKAEIVVSYPYPLDLCRILWYYIQCIFI